MRQYRVDDPYQLPREWFRSREGGGEGRVVFATGPGADSERLRLLGANLGLSGTEVRQLLVVRATACGDPIAVAVRRDGGHDLRRILDPTVARLVVRLVEEGRGDDSATAIFSELLFLSHRHQRLDPDQVVLAKMAWRLADANHRIRRTLAMLELAATLLSTVEDVAEGVRLRFEELETLEQRVLRALLAEEEEPYPPAP